MAISGTQTTKAGSALNSSVRRFLRSITALLDPNALIEQFLIVLNHIQTVFDVVLEGNAETYHPVLFELGPVRLMAGFQFGNLCLVLGFGNGQVHPLRANSVTLGADGI